MKASLNGEFLQKCMTVYNPYIMYIHLRIMKRCDLTNCITNTKKKQKTHMQLGQHISILKVKVSMVAKPPGHFGQHISIQTVKVSMADMSPTPEYFDTRLHALFSSSLLSCTPRTNVISHLSGFTNTTSFFPSFLSSSSSFSEVLCHNLSLETNNIIIDPGSV